MKNVSRNSLIFVFCFVLLSIVLSICGVSKDIFYSNSEVNEKRVIAKILNLISNQLITFKSEKKYAAAKELEIERRQENGYKIEMTSDEKSFQIWAIPNEYGKSGKMSFYADSNDGDVHGADHQGEKATFNDPIIQSVLDETKNELRNNRESNKTLDLIK